jgi:hypothetical protein
MIKKHKILNKLALDLEFEFFWFVSDFELRILIWD